MVGELLPPPKHFFVTSGKAISKVSASNAFDQALLDAGIGNLNLVAVSSVLPEGIRQVAPSELVQGAITFCVLADERGNEGETISAGIAYAFAAEGKGGYVARGQLHGGKKILKEILEWKMDEMAKLRDMEMQEIKVKIEEVSIPVDHYGSCVAALVFLF